MSKVVAIHGGELPRSKMVDDFAAILRRLADDVEAGKVQGFCGIYNDGEQFVTMFPSAPYDCVAMASMLQGAAIRKFMP